MYDWFSGAGLPGYMAQIALASAVFGKHAEALTVANDWLGPCLAQDAN